MMELEVSKMKDGFNYFQLLFSYRVFRYDLDLCGDEPIR